MRGERAVDGFEVVDDALIAQNNIATPAITTTSRSGRASLAPTAPGSA